MKNNIELIAYAKAQIGKPYWFGTFGQKATKKLLEEKAKQYPRQFSAKRQEKALADHIGQKVHDCYGLFKGFLMSADGDASAKYDSKYDISADMAFERATEKGEISSLPEIAGIGLWKKGHFGIYIGGGREIEARGFDYGVVEDDVKNTKFTHWFKMPEIEYASNSSGNAPVSSSQDSDEEFYIVKKGDSLSKIGAKYGVSVSDLVKWNNIKNPDLIQIGQKIKIKGEIAQNPNEYFEGRVATKSLPLRVRSQTSLDAPVLRLLPKGTKVKIAYETGGWGKLFGEAGFVSMAYITKI